jgi:hypothetical protein
MKSSTPKIRRMRMVGRVLVERAFYRSNLVEKVRATSGKSPAIVTENKGIVFDFLLANHDNCNVSNFACYCA